MPADDVELREFLLRACHDLRTPLRAVRINAELLLKDPGKREGPEFEQLLGFLVTGSRNADELVNGLANYALALSVQRNSLPVSAGILLKSALAKLAPEIREAGARVVFDDLPRTTADPDRMVQLFENLLRNAIQARAGAEPEICVGGREQEGGVLFWVRDNGPGIDAEDLDRIFRPFERLHRERGSAGLGLAICRAIVSGHGGRIWAESEPGSGATFYFTIPAD